MENTTTAIAEIIARLNARLDALEQAVAELTGKKPAPARETEIAQEPAQEIAEAALPERSWKEDMAAIANSAEEAARLLDEVSTLFCNAPTTYEPFCAPVFIKVAMGSAVRCLADCREALARRAGGEQLDEVAPCDIDMLYFLTNVCGAPTERSLLNTARIAASSARDIAADARKGLKSRRARKNVAISFNAALASALRMRDYIIGDEQKEAIA